MKSDFSRYGDKKDGLFIETGVHVTPKGAEVMAEGLYELILKNLTRLRACLAGKAGNSPSVKAGCPPAIAGEVSP
ncbi:MAG: hypothetical protein A2Z72_05735 [Omnitrophica bacterium RBG_13_46_9]|nr:MAG: hypothetical protein A2Z72_05735 [Omnitrophica bacterium RBG_13_46_9]